MENTKNQLPPNAYIFFNQLKTYLNTKLYFFGSIQRTDYFPIASDIDVDIFTDNIHSTILKLHHFLSVERKKIKKIIWKLNNNNKVIIGYKIFYTHPEYNFSAEISINEEKYKEYVLKEHNGKNVLPFYASWLLIILKFIYYKLHLIPHEWFKYFKKIILSTLIFKKDDHYIVLK